MMDLGRKRVGSLFSGVWSSGVAAQHRSTATSPSTTAQPRRGTMRSYRLWAAINFVDWKAFTITMVVIDVLAAIAAVRGLR